MVFADVDFQYFKRVPKSERQTPSEFRERSILSSPMKMLMMILSLEFLDLLQNWDHGFLTIPRPIHWCCGVKEVTLDLSEYF